MPWDTSKPYKPYFYKVGKLKAIALNYDNYDPNSGNFDSRHFESAIEFKADFDRAKNLLGNRRQKVIEAYMGGVPNYELRRRGFYGVGKFRFQSFELMARFLNGGEQDE